MRGAAPRAFRVGHAAAPSAGRISPQARGRSGRDDTCRPGRRHADRRRPARRAGGPRSDRRVRRRASPRPVDGLSGRRTGNALGPRSRDDQLRRGRGDAAAQGLSPGDRRWRAGITRCGERGRRRCRDGRRPVRRARHLYAAAVAARESLCRRGRT